VEEFLVEIVSCCNHWQQSSECILLCIHGDVMMTLQDLSNWKDSFRSQVVEKVLSKLEEVIQSHCTHGRCITLGVAYMYCALIPKTASRKTLPKVLVNLDINEPCFTTK